MTYCIITRSDHTSQDDVLAWLRENTRPADNVEVVRVTKNVYKVTIL